MSIMMKSIRNPVRVHIGCGVKRYPGFKNCDIYPGEGIDHVFDAQDRWPFEDNSVDEIVANHVLEHLDRPVDFMSEVERVLRPGGVIQIAVPYGLNRAGMGDITHKRPYYMETFACFTRDYYTNTFNPQHDPTRWPHQFEIVDAKYYLRKPFWWPIFRPLFKFIAENIPNACFQISVVMQKVPDNAKTENKIDILWKDSRGNDVEAVKMEEQYARQI